ncbi:MAG: hypothetical protein ACP5UF_08065 [Hydrogenobaculum sp.]
MLIKGIYLDSSVILRKTKNSFEILKNQDKEDVTVRVLPAKDAILIKDTSNIDSNLNVIDISGYRFLTKKPVDFDVEDTWALALLRALDVMQYDNLYVVFKDVYAYLLCRVENKDIVYYEVIFDKDELTDRLNTIEGDILYDIEDVKVPNLRALPMLYVKKGELIAFGGALKKVKDKFNRIQTISFQKLKKELVSMGIFVAGILISYGIFLLSVNYQIKMVEKKEKYVFKKAFPNTPIVDIKEQTEASIIPKDSFRLSKLLLKAYQNLPPDAKVYELFYKDNALSVKSEISSYELSSLENVISSRNLSQENKQEVIQRWSLGR